MFRRVGVALAALLVLSPAVAAASPALPTTIALPAGFRPEGIAIGKAPVSPGRSGPAGAPGRGGDGAGPVSGGSAGPRGAMQHHHVESHAHGCRQAVNPSGSLTSIRSANGSKSAMGALCAVRPTIFSLSLRARICGAVSRGDLD